MNNWTPAARQALERYLNQNRRKFALAGGDADEVIADLQRHIEQEAAALNLSTVTEQDVQRLLARMGSVGQEENETPIDERESAKDQPWLSWLGSGVLFLFGVLLPAGTLIFELVSEGCAEIFFDPIPTWIHALMIAVVPAANLLAWLSTTDRLSVSPRWTWLANGAAVGVSLFYALMFIPTLPIALFGIVMWGLGLLPLSPLLSLICALRLKHFLRADFDSHPKPKGWAYAVLIPFTVLVAISIQSPLTRYWINQAEEASENEVVKIVQRLRTFGDEEEILRACYGRTSREMLPIPVKNSELARSMFYRVTGKPFNSIVPPIKKGEHSRSLFNEFEWDSGLGGETVAGQVKGLSMSASRIDATCQPEEGWGYAEWIMEFKNDHPSSEREARAQIQLPPDGVVSRLTLWVNGEEREAAFAGRGEVREAYQKVAIQERRDPVLVTTSGPDRVLMQCFPVPRKGGTMKIRLGITFPLIPAASDRLALKLPCIVERNFRLPDAFEHSVWLQSSQPPLSGLGKIGEQAATHQKTSIHGQVKEADLGAPSGIVWFKRSPENTVVYALNKKTLGTNIIEQRLEAVPAKPPGRVAIVVDGSSSMTPHFREIIEAWESLAKAAEVKIFFVKDGLTEHDEQSAAVGALLSEEGIGGQDNLPALVSAWDWVADSKESPNKVVWIHGSQPILLSSVENLKQRLERSAPEVATIIDIPVEPGPNRITENLSTSSAIAAMTRMGSLADDLKELAKSWIAGEQTYRYIRTYLEEPKNVEQATASSHIVRLWARERILALIASRQVTAAVAHAGLYQLVTPVSGAVVLETKQQFEQAGLTPVDAASVPTIPEPTTFAVLALAFVLFFISMKRRTKAE